MSAITETRDPGPEIEKPEDFRTSEDLRCVLCRLDDQGPDAWMHDPTAAGLMEYACGKYAALAIRHGLDPWEAASAAFDVMRTRAVREARDPWAVVTHAVRITCIYEERAQGLLCSVHQARRADIAALHDPERFTDRAFPLADDHPVFAVIDDRLDQLEDSDPEPSTVALEAAVENAVELLALLDWPPATARGVVEHVCDALMQMGSRGSARESLRHDAHACALFDIPPCSWHALLRTLLGNTSATTTWAGRGVLVRLLIGDTIPTMLADDDLVLALSVAAPGLTR